MVENHTGEAKRVEYAADLNARLFGTPIGTTSMQNLPEESTPYVKHPWNLSNF
jgi:hypothetical protein